MHYSGTALVLSAASSHTPIIPLEAEPAHRNARLEPDSSWSTTHVDLHSIARSAVQYVSSFGHAPLVGDASVSLLRPEPNVQSQSHLLSDVHGSISNINPAQITIPFDRDLEPELCPGWFDMNHMIDDNGMSSQPRSNFPMFDLSNERSCTSDLSSDLSFMSDFSNSSNLSYNLDLFQDSNPNYQANNGPYNFTFDVLTTTTPLARLGGNASYSVNGDGQMLGDGIASPSQSSGFTSDLYSQPGMPGRLPSTPVAVPQMSVIMPSTTQTPVATLLATQTPVATLSTTTQTPVITPSTTQTPIATLSATQMPVTTLSTTQTPVATLSTTQTPIVTLSATQMPVITPSTTQTPIATLSATQTPVPTSSTDQTTTQIPFAASLTAETSSVAPSTQIPVGALPKPRKKGPGRAAANISALSQSLSSNEAAALASPTPSVPQSTVGSQPKLSSNDILSTSSATSSLPLGPAGNQPTEEVRRSGCPVVPSKRSEVVPITSKTTPTSQNEKENVPPGTPPDWAVQAKNHLLVRDMGEEWKKCVGVWSELEGKLGYGCLTGTKVMHHVFYL